MDTVRSRAHRILRHLHAYREQNGSSLPIILHLAPDEEVLGSYENVAEEFEDTILVTNRRLCTVIQREVVSSVAYEDMEEVALGGDGKSTTEIHITTSDANRLLLSVRGRRGRFRDSLEFLRFLDRAMHDSRKRSSESDTGGSPN